MPPTAAFTVHRRALDNLLPPRLGRDFRLLFAASTISNLGDGIMLAAGPLLVASITSDPLAVAGAAAALQAPWLLLSVIAGAIIDRVSKKQLLVAMNALRAVVLVVLAIATGTGLLNVPLIIVAMFVLGCAEVFSDNAVASLPQLIVADPADYGIANARTLATFMIGNQLIGPPLAALLFGVAHLLPLTATTAFIVLAVGLLTRITIPPPHRDGAPQHLRHDIAEGLRWLWGNPPVRTLAVLIAGFNVTFGAAWGVLVLLAHQRLGMSANGYAQLLAAMAVGGVIGSWAYPHLERRFSLATLMRVGLILETLTHLALALITAAWAALAVMVVFGLHAAVWGTTSTTIKQRAIPKRLFARVNSVYMLCVFGTLVIGQLIGGLIARWTTITGPYWFAFAGSALLTVGLWRQMAHVAHADATKEG